MTTGPGTGRVSTKAAKATPVDLAAELEEDNLPWFRLDTARVVTLSFKSKYATGGYAPVQRIDTAEARELAEALENAARDLDGAA